MHLFIIILLTAFVACAGFLLGILCVRVGSIRGPKGAIATGAVVSLVCIVAGCALGNANQSWLEGAIGGAICALSNGITVWYFGRRLVPFINYVPSLHKSVSSFGLNNFELMDNGNKGNITIEDLRYFRRSLQSSDNEIEIVDYMLEHIHEIGHYIFSHQTEVDVLKRWPKRIRSNPKTLVVIASVYGISREDLQSYPQRAKGKRKRHLDIGAAC